MDNTTAASPTNGADNHGGGASNRRERAIDTISAATLMN
jgi:hypothetical protein